ncbi:50S ribosomal protein L13 [[Mycoplasma] testudinis]|uniref:50S ribosomal protein L13 n=1 Tax=[Mycoplasma] testudinis TaxID=33924 RepID=UPI000484E2F0|nr:50S ribosomal protein L13 [[Mycoplasma] testudinis]
MQKTTMLKKEAAIKNRKWFAVDASNLILGKLAVKAADLLRGKNKADFTPNQDCGDFLIIYNTDKVLLSGNKALTEKWYRHSQHIGGIKSRTGKEMLEQQSDKLVYGAIEGMLPGNRISKFIIRKLKVYKGPEYKESAQNPTVLDWSPKKKGVK